MGTVVEITVSGASEKTARAAMSEAFDAMGRVDRDFSWSNPAGELARLNSSASGRAQKVVPEMLRVLEEALEIAEASGGAFDPTIGPLARLWNFEGGGVVPGDEAIASAMAKVGFMNLDLDPESSEVGFRVDGMQVDLGGIAKGLAIDLAAGVLMGHGVRSAIVDAGGDLRLIGAGPGRDFWRIGVQDPRDASRMLLSLDLAGVSVATSGDYERFFERDGVRYHHLLDPATGRPARGCRSVTVVAPTALEADACATAAFVLGPERGVRFLRSRPGVRGLVVAADGALRWSHPGLSGEGGR
jgi:thiamine biosynthesis lipoprotein